MSLNQPFLDREDKQGNIYLNSDYAQLRVDIFKIIYGLVESEKRAELLTEDILNIVDKFIKEKE